jgi:hypothetical protein
MPKRPLSAYNLFFKEQRQLLLGEELSRVYPVNDQTKRKHRRSHGKVGFQEMASIIGKKWKQLAPNEQQVYKDMAAVEKRNYKDKVERWRNGEDIESETDTARTSLDVSSRTNFSDAPSFAARNPQKVDPMAHTFSDLSGVARSPPSSLPNPMTTAMNQYPMHQSHFAAAQPSSALAPQITARMAMQQSAGMAGPMGEGGGDRFGQLQQLYELRVREAAMLRQEMQRSMAFSGGDDPLGASIGSSMNRFPAQGHQSFQTSMNPMGNFPGDSMHVRAHGQSEPSLQQNWRDGAALSASYRQLQLQQSPQFSNEMIALPERQLTNEAWQRQLAIGSGVGLPAQQMPQDTAAALRDQRAQAIQRALETERSVRAGEELLRFLRRQSGGGM